MKPLALLLLTVVSVSPALASDPVPTISPQEINKAVARRVFEDIFNRGNLQAADEIYARDFVNHGLHRDAGLEEDQAAARWEKTLLPDSQPEGRPDHG